MQTKVLHHFYFNALVSCSLTLLLIDSANYHIPKVPSHQVNNFHAADVSRRQVQKCHKICQKCQDFWTSLLYLESPWEMHSNKYKHAWYWFKNVWNFEHFEKQNDFVWMGKLMAACKVLNITTSCHEIQIEVSQYVSMIHNHFDSEIIDYHLRVLWCWWETICLTEAIGCSVLQRSAAVTQHRCRGQNGARKQLLGIMHGVCKKIQLNESCVWMNLKLFTKR